jgi:hypothetical protein
MVIVIKIQLAILELDNSNAVFDERYVRATLQGS